MVMDLMNGVQQWCRGGLKALPVRAGDRAVCDEALAGLHQQEKGANAMPAGNGDGPKVEMPGRKGGWTQPDVDAEIRRLIKKHSRKLQQLGKAVRAGLPGAEQAWRGFFGRNTLRRKLNCPAAMVTHSRPWQAIAQSLGLAGRKPGVGRGDRVGLEIGDEGVAQQEWRDNQAAS